MSTQATGHFDIKKWDEQPIHGREGLPKLTRATVLSTFRGDIEGDGVVEYLMLYREDGTASFVGLQRVEGRLGGNEGTFVLQVIGAFEGGTAHGTWTIVPGSGTAALRSLRGEGGFKASHGQPMSQQFTLAYNRGD